ncbi:MAG: hypothetical protein U0136_19035 [Bdellovibrionota bacterium]
MNQSIRVLAISMILLPLGSCFAVQGYLGPARPDDETALVSLQYSSSSVDVGSASIDGYDLRRGVRVLPGEHAFSLVVSAKDPPMNCRDDGNFDRQGYDSCKRNEKRVCNCSDFYSVNRTCDRKLYDHECSGTVSVQAGQSTTLRLGLEGWSVQLGFSGSSSLRNSGSCRHIGDRVVSESEVVTGVEAGYPYGCW